MTHKRFKKVWNLLRLWLIVRELKHLSARAPRGASTLGTSREFNFHGKLVT
jgi:hypothetical protein